ALEAKLDEASFARMRAATREVVLDVGIPRFRMEPEALALGSALSEAGMPLAFDPHADFSGIARMEDGLYITDVFHKAFIEVNEEGTEAAAATAAPMMPRGLARPPRGPRFVADHPFVFVLVDERTGAVLFLGRVADPRRAAR